MAATNFSLMGALSTFTELNTYKFLRLARDPINCVTRFTIDVKRLIQAIKDARIKDTTGTLGLEAGDKFAIFKIPKGSVLSLPVWYIHKPETTQTAKAAGFNQFQVGDSGSASRFQVISTGNQAAAVTLGAIGINTGQTAYKTDDYLLLTVPAVDATHDLPADGIFEFGIQNVEFIPDASAVGVTL